MALFQGSAAQPVYIVNAGTPVVVTNSQNGLTTTSQSKAVAAGNIISATNAAATVTLADPGVGVSNVIGEVIFSYNGTPTAGRLTITDNATIVRDVDITTSGPGPIIFNPPLKMTAHNATTITLAAGGSGVVGKVNVTAWTE